MRGRSLSLCVDDLRAELLQATGTNLGVNARDVLIRKLQSAQNFLFLDKVWPHKRIWSPKNLSAGSRYYDFPTRIKLENLVSVHVLYNGVYSDPLDRGIGLEHYNAYNSEDDVRADPVQRWDVRDINGTAQMEVHPMPASNTTNGLMIVGRADLAAFTDDAHVCDLDSEAIVLQAAADYLERTDPAKSAMLRSRATTLVNRLIGGSGKSKNRYTFTDGQSSAEPAKDLRVVYAR